MIKTIEITDEYIQSLSVEELKDWCKDAQPIELNYTPEEIEQSEKIYAVMDLTDLDYADVEKILYAPKQATLGDIMLYCKRLNINIVDFINTIKD